MMRSAVTPTSDTLSLQSLGRGSFLKRRFMKVKGSDRLKIGFATVKSKDHKNERSWVIFDVLSAFQRLLALNLMRGFQDVILEHIALTLLERASLEKLNIEPSLQSLILRFCVLSLSPSSMSRCCSILLRDQSHLSRPIRQARDKNIAPELTKTLYDISLYIWNIPQENPDQADLFELKGHALEYAKYILSPFRNRIPNVMSSPILSLFYTQYAKGVFKLFQQRKDASLLYPFPIHDLKSSTPISQEQWCMMFLTYMAELGYDSFKEFVTKFIHVS
ncbi:hypothetical protein HDU76_004861 [Blyttiomyces sp. JEL0837]|nr:hypothetical protein HDU76_004861 [Blyttiomyces sp. JEL0837]